MGSSWRDVYSHSFYFRRECMKSKAHDTIKKIFIIFINISFANCKRWKDNHRYFPKDFISDIKVVVVVGEKSSREMKSDIAIYCAVFMYCCVQVNRCVVNYNFIVSFFLSRNMNYKCIITIISHHLS